MTTGATCQDFRPDTGSGRVVLDDGRSLPFATEAFAASGLRLLRPGQRLEVELDADRLTVTALRLPGAEAAEA
ncbi:MAG: hypothetical protein R2737_08160 [Candidatus Nanopelagicales bacterium]